MPLSDWNLEASEELGMERALQEEARCSVCGAEINNDSLICTACDKEMYFPEEPEK